MRKDLTPAEFKILENKLAKYEQMAEQCNEFNDPEIQNLRIPLDESIKQIKEELGIE